MWRAQAKHGYQAGPDHAAPVRGAAEDVPSSCTLQDSCLEPEQAFNEYSDGALETLDET